MRIIINKEDKMKVKKLLKFMKENTDFIPSWKEEKGGGLHNPHFWLRGKNCRLRR